MEFNDTTNRNGIVQNIEVESKLGLATISDNSAPDYYLNYFLSKVNEWLHIVNHWIGQVNDEWVRKDINNTEDILETYDCAVSTQSYDLDSDVVKIRQVQVHDATKAATKGWSDLDYNYEVDRDEDLYGQSDGAPSSYFLEGRKIIFDCPVDIAKVDKYRIKKDMHAHEFVIGDTDVEPGFDKQFHWILVYGPIMDWASGKFPDIYNKCRIKIFGLGEGDPNALKDMLQEHYVKQNQNMKYFIGREKKNYD